MNGINYNFTKEEVKAVAELLKMARFIGGEEGQRLSKIIATAFNREAFKTIYEEESNDKSGQTSDG